MKIACVDNEMPTEHLNRNVQQVIDVKISEKYGLKIFFKPSV